MAKMEVLMVEKRETFGKRRSRRLRESGFIPATLYGHGQEAVSISVATDRMNAIIRHGHHFVALDGAASGDAQIKEVQWDTWGKEILHVDFTRVQADEKINVIVPLTLRGEAPGTRQGGVVEQVLHEIDVQCAAINAPDQIEVRIGTLELDQVITVADITFPSGVTSTTAPDTVIVHCFEKKEVEETETAVTGEEPEVIARKKAEEEE